LPKDGSMAQTRRSAAFTPLQRGQTKPGEPFHHPAVAPLEAT